MFVVEFMYVCLCAMQIYSFSFRCAGFDIIFYGTLIFTVIVLESRKGVPIKNEKFRYKVDFDIQNSNL